MKSHKILILGVFTGRYTLFWPDFYSSIKEFLCPGDEKTFFVFSDDRNLALQDKSNVQFFYQEHLPWPGITLHRYHIFLKRQQELSNYDFCFFFNANVRMRCPILRTEILPRSAKELVLSKHGMFSKLAYTVETNPRSSAYIPFDAPIHQYHAGGIYGAAFPVFRDLLKANVAKVEEDRKKGMIPIYHDESILNRYALEYEGPVRVLDPSFLCPYSYNQMVENPFSPRIILLDKSSLGGHDYLRGQTNVPLLGLQEEEEQSINNFLQNRPSAISVALSENFGLGAQLFQLTAAISLAHKHHGVSVHLQCNSSLLEEYDLSRLECWAKDTLVTTRVYQEEKFFDYSSGFFHLDRGITLRGWFQDWRYSESILPLLRENLELPLDTEHTALASLVEQSNQAVAVHICRGFYRDDRNRAMRPLVPIAYYQKAVDFVLEYITAEANFFIFTDDPDWVRANWSYNGSWTLVETGSTRALQDFELMRRCRHFILSASSFGWWAARLGEKSDSIVLIPPFWNLMYGQKMCDMSPPNWKMIDWFSIPKRLEKPKVSVVFYVGGERDVVLEARLESIARQTLEEIEILVIDDESDAISAKLIGEYARKDQRIQVIRKKFDGLGSARNYAIDKARGTYLYFIDPYTSLHPKMLAILYHEGERNGVKIIACSYLGFTDIQIPKGRNVAGIPLMDEQILQSDYPLYEDRTFSFDRKSTLNHFFLYKDGLACNKLYHRNLFEGGFRYAEETAVPDLGAVPLLGLFAGSMRFVSAVLCYRRQDILDPLAPQLPTLVSVKDYITAYYWLFKEAKKKKIRLLKKEVHSYYFQYTNRLRAWLQYYYANNPTIYNEMAEHFYNSKDLIYYVLMRKIKWCPITILTVYVLKKLRVYGLLKNLLRKFK